MIFPSSENHVALWSNLIKKEQPKFKLVLTKYNGGWFFTEKEFNPCTQPDCLLAKRCISIGSSVRPCASEGQEPVSLYPSCLAHRFSDNCWTETEFSYPQSSTLNHHRYGYYLCSSHDIFWTLLGAGVYLSRERGIKRYPFAKFCLMLWIFNQHRIFHFTM